MEAQSRSARGQEAPALAALLVGVAVWLWPIGFGGRMPVGGDVTQFSMGLMAFLGRSLQSGRLPIWNDLWGYGFPGLAESQMGVFYPPHLFLYGLLPTEWAYTLSLVIHTFWAALGAFWAARRFGILARGAALSGFAWTASGFYLIHLPHQWGYTTGSWMPWAWGLAWQLARGEGSRRTPFLLALVLTLQVFPGHFQLAFCTQVGVVLISLAGLFPRIQPARRLALGAIALGAVLPLAAVQLWPTYRLARLASADRDFEYLSGFAASPLHLVSYFAPELFHRSPLWRPLVWDPFHTSPEEHLAYIGLVPLFLAIVAIARGLRREPAVRVLGLLALITLIFSLGPYVPGFSLWSGLPGFSFFRAPARWGLATGLALSLLAGKGLDELGSLARPGRSLARFAVISALLVGAVVGLLELALASRDRPILAKVFERAMKRRPWDDGRGFRAVLAEARRPQNDFRVATGMARLGMSHLPRERLRFVEQRGSIYGLELTESAVLLVALLAVASVARRRSFFEAALLALTALDLWWVGHHRPIDTGPIRALASQSPVLASLADEPRGTRTVDTLRNLPMVVGAAPISAYRTLDLPALGPLTSLAFAPIGRAGTAPAIVAALRDAGASVRILGPFETLATTPPGPTIHDPALAGWLYGVPWVEAQDPRASTFTIWRQRQPTSIAWRLPLTLAGRAAILGTWSGDTGDVLRVLSDAIPLPARTSSPEHLSIEVDDGGPALVVISQLADPQWRASWVGPEGTTPVPIKRAFARTGELGWQAVVVPGTGRGTLRLDYEATDVRQGAAVSALAWLAGIALYYRFGRTSTVSRGEPS